jgi:rhamnosyltransferase
MKILAVVTLYNPPSNFIENISSYLKYVDTLFIVENSVIENTPEYKIIKGDNRVVIYSEKKNIGVSGAFNKAIEYFSKNQFEALLLMDQDSKFINFSIFDLVSKVFLDNSIGIVSASSSPIIDDRWFISDYDINFYQQKLIMSSGSFISRKLVEHNKFFRDDFFLDEVDHEYSLRSFHSGFINLISKKIYLTHNVGETQILNSLFFGKKQYGLHPPIRYYYIFRNSRKLIRQYLFKDFSFVYHTIIRLFKIFFNLIFFFPSRSIYLRFIIRSFL